MSMNDYTNAVNTRETLQTEPIPGRSQVQNNAGGYGWAVDDWKRLRRFLILGSESGTYYQTARKLTSENAEAVIRCIKTNGVRVVNEIEVVSDCGLAPKNDPAIFALAAASKLGDELTRGAAFNALPQVCRTGTHLFAFAEARQAFGGWGRGMRRAVKNWYLGKNAAQLALQLAKYRQRNGWTHCDLLRLSHPMAKDEETQRLFQWAVGKADGSAGTVSPLIDGMILAATADVKRLPGLIEEYGLTREMIPTEHLSHPEVQWALMQKQGLTALLRNLGNYSKSGLLKPLSEAEKFVCHRLSDAEELRRLRVHPFAVLLAARTYAAGHGMRDDSVWTPCPKVVDALDDAFYAAFENVETTGKTWLLGIDVSGSMRSAKIAGSPITPHEAAAAMAMVAVRSEQRIHAMGFSTDFVDLGLSPKMRLDSVLARTKDHPFEGTDCSLPMSWALENRVEVDQFVIYTDNETWAGVIHPKQMLDRYRQRMGREARLAVVAFTSGGFTIADPEDAGMLDCVGLDAALPQVLRSFAMGQV